MKTKADKIKAEKKMRVVSGIEKRIGR